VTVKKSQEFFDIDGLVHHEFVPPGQNVTGHFYVQVLQWLRYAVHRKCHYKRQGQWSLHHDNAPSHISLVGQQLLAEKNILVFIQPPYSLDLTPSDFWLFRILKVGLKGTCSATMEAIKSNAMVELRKIQKEAFRRCFQQWKDRWSKCVWAQWFYFVGDWVSVAVCPTNTAQYLHSGNFLIAHRILQDTRHACAALSLD
jgi:hypothetical protein